MKPRILVIAIALVMAACSSSDNSSDPVVNVPAGSDNNPNPDSNGTGDIPGTDGGSVDNEPVALELVGQNLLVSLAGFQADRLSLYVRELAVEIATAAEAMPQPDSTFETLDGFGPEVVVTPTQVTAYSCNAGGQMIHASGQLRDGLGSERSLAADHDSYTFDACRHSEASGVFAAGDYQLDGTLVMDASDYSASRGGRSGHLNSWGGFAMSVPGDLAYELSGSVEVSAYSAANFGSGDTRTVELATYSKSENAQTAESLEDVHLSLVRTIPNGSDDSSYQLDADGAVVTLATQGETVTINTDPILSGSRVDAQGNAEAFNGQIRMVASDGGELILSANPTSQISIEAGDLLVDFVALRPDGESVTGDAIPLIDIIAGSFKRGCFLSGILSDCGVVELP
ncbi:hypothetical protein [Granulosicoccus antarcticus]|uniref:Uncharacterized protein n=1 Tax=Granulosicoccus antarcticus IMCC3135 TaxID=1192854 RepID=A0A2Z2P7L7_9GAMM|nr:hypothetical protein [Granulosicoccus antarcticus]ASJ75834.1 hypothetical protein IMCC3135_28910 [Granulosicoccus antarcticus IMCC3135]